MAKHLKYAIYIAIHQKIRKYQFLLSVVTRPSNQLRYQFRNAGAIIFKYCSVTLSLYTNKGYRRPLIQYQSCYREPTHLGLNKKYVLN